MDLKEKARLYRQTAEAMEAYANDENIKIECRQENQNDQNDWMILKPNWNYGACYRLAKTEPEPKTKKS